mmetsp:Transcript_112671/g.318334  ORF Transcript_112671/g.318334 Transcript_112671/m.318334 type:complete len:284 (-) Transcript_112671:903-1754(-)
MKSGSSLRTKDRVGHTDQSVIMACGWLFRSSFIAAFAKSSLTIKVRTCVPQSTPSITVAAGLCRMRQQTAAAAFCRVSSSRRRSPRSSPSAASTSGRALAKSYATGGSASTTFGFAASSAASSAPPVREALLPEGALGRLQGFDSSGASRVLSQAEAQSLSKRCSLENCTIRLTCAFKGTKASRCSGSSFLRASSMRTSRWQQLTTTSHIHGSSGKLAASSRCSTRWPPNLIMSRMRDLSRLPSVARPKFSSSLSNRKRRYSFRSTLQSRSSMRFAWRLRCAL